jgi:ankyrin repeat protein
MPYRPLPVNPSFENFRKQAKRLLRSVRSGDAQALAQVREFHSHAEAALADFKLNDAQLVTAREYGMSSWARLKQQLDVIKQFGWDPPENPASQSGPLAEQFTRFACLDYRNWRPNMVARAQQLVAEHPEIINADIYVAATVGAVDAVQAMIADDSAVVNKKGGALNWEPLLYACYSRLNSTAAGHSTLDVAKVLLEHGADPNAGFLWRGLVPPFTALTGAFGDGEAGPHNYPPHQHRDALVRLLLDSGADPNDGQALYNVHDPDNQVLKLLFSYGLGQEKGGPWRKRLGERMRFATPAGLLIEELWGAARANRFDRVKLLVEHGTDVNGRGFRDDRTAYEQAMLAGNFEIAEYLLEHGAKTIQLSEKEQFASACAAARRNQVFTMIEKSPEIIEQLSPQERNEITHKAVGSRRPEAARLVKELGFDLNGMVMNRTPMHDAAWEGRLETVKLLIELGANPQLHDGTYHGTPLGWADYNHQPHVVEYLLQFADVFDSVMVGSIERARMLLQEDPSRAHAVGADGYPLIFYVNREHKRLDEILDLLVLHGCDVNARDFKGKTMLDYAIAGVNESLVRALQRHGAKTSEESTGNPQG